MAYKVNKSISAKENLYALIQHTWPEYAAILNENNITLTRGEVTDPATGTTSLTISASSPLVTGNKEVSYTLVNLENLSVGELIALDAADAVQLVSTIVNNDILCLPSEIVVGDLINTDGGWTISLSAAEGALTVTGSTELSIAEEPGPEPKPFNGKRPYGENAPWNIPVSGIAVHPQSSTYVDALWNELPDHKTPEFNMRNYTYPVYNAKEATGEYTVTSENGWGNLDGQKVPFNENWEPAAGTDAQIIILDPDTGTEWNLWVVGNVNHAAKTLTVENGNKCAGNYWENNWDDPATQTHGSRGAGINYLAMLVRPWEIEQGKIEHALSMPIIGTSGSEFWPPATKLEHAGKTGTIPEGARFSLDVTYEEIDDHLNEIVGASEQLKHMVRVLLVALKDYGWFITDTAGGQSWQLESLASAESEWTRLGIYPEAYLPIYGQSALHPRFSAGGLLTKERIRLHVPSDQY